MSTEDHQALERERAELLARQELRQLSPDAEERLKQREQSLGGRTADTHAHVHSVVESGSEHIGLRGSVLRFDAGITDQKMARQALARIDLPGIQDALVKMTGHTPSNMPRITSLHSNHNIDGTQASITARSFSSLTHDPRDNRLRFRFKGLASIDSIDGNVDFLEAKPQEARGVYFHELGHVWTSRMYALDQGRSETYTEAFGELFRSAAAMAEGANWEQAAGCRGYDLLSGSELPNLVIPQWQNSHIPKPLYHAGRFAVCNRLIRHLGGLSERTLHGLAKACDAGTLPCEGNSLANVLQDIERETGAKDFAENFLHDPALQFGGMKAGPVIIGFPSANGDAYRIESFRITDPNPTWGMSKQQFTGMPATSIPINSSTFDFRGVRIEPIPFTLTLRHEAHDLTMKFTVAGGEIVLSPEQILNLALLANIGWPAGITSIEFSVSGQQPRKIDTQIIISAEQRAAFQKMKGVQSRR